MSSHSEDNQEFCETNSDSKQHTTSTNDESSNSEEPAFVNPTFTESECADDLKILKGDAIGETLYSERYVLNTLLKLAELDKDLQENEDVERDLCSLWDMTLEEDVVKYLLNHDVFELFAGIIKTSEDKRLLEILVGILGNMCNVIEARGHLTEKEEVIEILLDLSSCIDSLTLEQLMRLITVVFVKMSQDQIEIWYNYIMKSDKFVKNLCFILNNSANNSLILQTLECLNAILTKFFIFKRFLVTENGKTDVDDKNKLNFEELFVQSQVIESTIEAFKSLVKEHTEEEDSYEAQEIPESTYEAKQTFCNIHSILTQYEIFSREAYKSSNNSILKCFKDILQPMTEDNSITLWQQYEQDVLDTLNDVLRILPQPFDMDIVKYLLKLLYDKDKEHEKQLNKTTCDFESNDTDEDTDIDYQISYSLILNSLHYLIFKIDKVQLKQCVESNPKKYSLKLLESFEQPLETEYLKNCYQKLKEVFDE